MININPVTIIAGIFLLAMMLFDIKGKKIPAVLGTTGILACAFLIVWKTPSLISFGILGFILGHLLYEFNMFKGIADIKAIILISLTLASLQEFLLSMFLIGALSLSYQFILAKAFKTKHKEDIPLIPVFFLVWVILLFV